MKVKFEDSLSETFKELSEKSADLKIKSEEVKRVKSKY